MRNKPRLFYAAGPGDIVGTYRNWRDRRDDPSQVSVTYSSQFWDVCEHLGAKSFAVSSNRRKELLIDGSFKIENRPRPFPGARGILYHLAGLCYGLSLIASVVRFRADVAVVAEGTTHWFVLSILRVFGVRVIPTIHCVLWPKYKAIGSTQRLLNRLDGLLFFKLQNAPVLTASADITSQVEKLASPLRVIEFLPTYRRTMFEGIAEPPPPDCFHVLFAGRIEVSKGLFTVLEIARRLHESGAGRVVFDICGDGSALPELKERAERSGLSGIFRCHGHLTRDKMRQMFSRSHVVLVPTTTDFNEGFNQVVVEGVLAGRPVITSSVCPALEAVKDAVVEVPPDDLIAYHDAILMLERDRELYRRKRLACAEYQNKFYDESNGWAAALSAALA